MMQEHCANAKDSTLRVSCLFVDVTGLLAVLICWHPRGVQETGNNLHKTAKDLLGRSLLLNPPLFQVLQVSKCKSPFIQTLQIDCQPRAEDRNVGLQDTAKAAKPEIGHLRPGLPWHDNRGDLIQARRCYWQILMDYLSGAYLQI